MDCKEALLQTSGDFEKAIDWLRKKGIASARGRVRQRPPRAVVLWLCHHGSRNRSSRVYRCLSPQEALAVPLGFCFGGFSSTADYASATKPNFH
jgi:hypothetical protein